MSNSLTIRADLRYSLPFEVRDQGIRPVCVALAVTGAHEVIRGTAAPIPPVQLAPDALWSHAWNRGLAGPRGTSLAAVGHALSDEGQPENSEWPFDQSSTEPSLCPDEIAPPPWMRATLNELYLDLPILTAELLRGCPVVLIVHVTDEFQAADVTTGRIEVPAPATLGQGLHAILCLGFAEDNAGRPHYLVRNSWGTNWGLDGYGWLPEDYLNAFAVRMGTVMHLTP